MSATTTPPPVAYTVRDAAAAAGVSTDVIRRAIHSTGADGEIPPLPARRLGRRLLIRHEDLAAWVDGLPEG